MTPREWCLLQDGAAEREQARNRQIARWLSPLISATAGTVITPAALLGEEEPKDGPKRQAQEIRSAERALKAMQKKIARKNKRRNQKEKAKCQA